MNVKVQATGDDTLEVELGKLANALTDANKQAICHTGAEIVQRAVSDIVTRKAKTHRDGLLAGSITTDGAYSFGGYAGEDVGWAQTLVKRAGRTMHFRRNGQLRSQHRKVDTVDDYGRILEYSETRQLRHMHEGYEASQAQAAAAMEQQADELVKKIMR